MLLEDALGADRAAGQVFLEPGLLRLAKPAEHVVACLCSPLQIAARQGHERSLPWISCLQDPFRFIDRISR